MNFELKDKLKVTEEFLNDIITKNWQETEVLQQQIANIDTSTQLGTEVVRVLKAMCTNYYILIGCLEGLAEGTKPEIETNKESELVQDATELETSQDSLSIDGISHQSVGAESVADFEPFEYFVDFDEPSGEPLSDKDIYG